MTTAANPGDAVDPLADLLDTFEEEDEGADKQLTSADQPSNTGAAQHQPAPGRIKQEQQPPPDGKKTDAPAVARPQRQSPGRGLVDLDSIRQRQAGLVQMPLVSSSAAAGLVQMPVILPPDPAMPTASTCSTATIMGASTCSTAMPGGGIGTAVAGTAADVAVTSSTASSTGGGKTAASIITNAAAGAANTGVAGTGSSSSSSGSGTVGPNKTGQDNGGSTTTPTASGSGAPPTEHPGEGAVGKKSYAWQHVNQFRKHKGPAPVSVQLQQIRDRQKQQRQIELETRVKQFEKNSGFHLTNRCLTQEKFDACMRNKTKVELRELKRLVCTASNEYKDPFFKDKDVVLIVIAIHFAPQVSLGNGQVCSEWKICDLPTTVNPQAFVCTLRLQDQAFLGWTENRDAKQEWVKGSVFAVLNPVVTFQQSNHKYFVRVRHAAQLVKLGTCEDVGYCSAPSATRRNEVCGQPINKRSNASGLCHFHEEEWNEKRQKQVPGMGTKEVNRETKKLDSLVASLKQTAKNDEQQKQTKKDMAKEITKERDLWWLKRKTAVDLEKAKDAKLAGKSLADVGASVAPVLGRGVVDGKVSLDDDEDDDVMSSPDVATKATKHNTQQKHPPPAAATFSSSSGNNANKMSKLEAMYARMREKKRAAQDERAAAQERPGQEQATGRSSAADSLANDGAKRQKVVQKMEILEN